MKTCSLCKISKDKSEFGKNLSLSDGLMPNCKVCTNARARERYYKSDVARNAKYLQRYGIGLKEITSLAEAQDYKCSICNKVCAFLAGNRANALVVDHCHETGEVRGLICATCNRGLGLFYDDPILLRSAAEYLSG